MSTILNILCHFQSDHADAVNRAMGKFSFSKLVSHLYNQQRVKGRLYKIEISYTRHSTFSGAMIMVLWVILRGIEVSHFYHMSNSTIHAFRFDNINILLISGFS
jgi:hypothetical protein